jgi:hypothetical protein
MDSDKMEEIVAPKPTKATPQKKKKKKNGTILSFFKNESPTPPRKKRPASPPHEMVPEDNPDIAVSDSRVNRVLSRRDRAAYSLYPAARHGLTFIFIVHCHVPITIPGRFPTQDTSFRTPRYRTGRR